MLSIVSEIRAEGMLVNCELIERLHTGKYILIQVFFHWTWLPTKGNRNIWQRRHLPLITRLILAGLVDRNDGQSENFSEQIPSGPKIVRTNL